MFAGSLNSLCFSSLELKRHRCFIAELSICKSWRKIKRWKKSNRLTFITSCRKIDYTIVFDEFHIKWIRAASFHFFSINLHVHFFPSSFSSFAFSSHFVYNRNLLSTKIKLTMHRKVEIEIVGPIKC